MTGRILTAVLTIYETCQFFVIVGQVMFTDTTDLSVFVTNTFFSTLDCTNDDWSGEPVAYCSQQNTRLYSCMWVAQAVARRAARIWDQSCSTHDK